jgi:hypothetical protein
MGEFAVPGGFATRLRRSWVLALVCSLCCVSAAHAANDPLGSGRTQLVLDKRFGAFLAKDAVKLTAQAGAKRKGRVYVLPVIGGSLDTTVGKGEIDQEGSLVFQNARKKVPLREITVKTKHSPLIAKVGGGQLKIANSSKLSAKRAGFGSEFTAKALTLTAKVATRLNKKLRPKVPFAEGQPLGTLISNAQPQLATVLETGRASFTFDAAFLAKLESRFVSVNPIFPAEHQGPVFTFPIVVGGAIAPDGSAGTLRTGGAVELLQLGAGQVFWREPWLDLGARSDRAEVDVEPTPAFPGKLGRIALLGLAGGAISSDPRARTVSLSAAPLTLDAQTAATLNEAFAEHKEVFKAGELAGTLSFTAQAQ